MRVKHAVASKKRVKKILSQAKGFWGERSKRLRRAIETLRRAYVYAYAHRRLKKREFRSLWIVRLNAAARERGSNYGTLMGNLKKSNVLLSRDILAAIAADEPKVFDAIMAAAEN
jgi:large subunit ribosomal protein L20